jgi:hypothetical protein
VNAYTDTIVDWADAPRSIHPGRLALLFAVHIALGLLVVGNPALSTAHALVVFIVGAVGVLFGAGAVWVACAVAYTTGADVLWRMTEAGVFHQYSKYAGSFLFLLWMVRNRKFRLSRGPLLYFALLVPSIAVVVAHGGREGTIQRPISFNLSGPLLLAVAVLFFRQVRLEREEVLRIAAAFVLPVIAVCTIAASSTMEATRITFMGSNMVTSGGYGPNQVSAALGLGSLFMLLLVLLVRMHLAGRALLLAGCLALAIQSALTFSRGGLYTAGGALLIGLPFLFVTPRGRARLAGAGVILVILIAVLAVPWLQAFTGDQFLRRIQDTDLTGRDDLMRRDLAVWSENLLLGVGPGMASNTHIDDMSSMMVHTEFTRLIAEHGALGVIALLLLFGMALLTLRDSRRGVPRGLAACFTGWALLSMIHLAMRIAAPSFMFGFGAAMVGLRLEDKDPTPSPPAPRPAHRERRIPVPLHP